MTTSASESDCANDFPSSPKYPSFATDLLSVDKTAIFVKDNANDSFRGKLKLKNTSFEYVTFMIRSSNRKMFKIKPRFGYLKPQASQIITVVTKRGKKFHEFSKDSFGVLALAIHDQRQLALEKLDMLWRAYGTDLFPFDCVEFHTIQHVVPKRDTYNDDLSLLERLCHMKFLKPHFNPKVMGDDTFKKSVDEESFHQIWPTVGPPSKDDRSLDHVLSEWHMLASEIHHQTNSLMQGAKMMVALVATTATTCLTLGLVYLSQPETEPLVEMEQPPASQTWLSWLKVEEFSKLLPRLW